ncbi:hypothetical protein N8I71_12980 [Roseibacterium sp. SDUM158016]|uniref:hypothetical protein n=1 Tax=Roseicyclus sediminis TaxID=2980997 RepID=UPI0021CF5A60|nr:hypothetical protein [Roseibacterium sp. SDUM158016]MCU4653751.1 hypothetical protein [Roseibacterium sp. SDUM158016]
MTIDFDCFGVNASSGPFEVADGRSAGQAAAGRSAIRLIGSLAASADDRALKRNDLDAGSWAIGLNPTLTETLRYRALRWSRFCGVMNPG